MEAKVRYVRERSTVNRQVAIVRYGRRARGFRRGYGK